MSRLAIHDAQGADREAFRRQKRHARIETNERLINDERIVVEPFVEQSILDNETVLVQNSVPAKGNVPRRLAGLHTHTSFEPLAVRVNQTNQGCRRVTDVRRQAREIVESIL